MNRSLRKPELTLPREPAFAGLLLMRQTNWLARSLAPRQQ
jgi:hypothetical protein